MADAGPSPNTTSQPPYPTRFGWGMRLFLCLLLFWITFRSLSVLFPWDDWADEFDMWRKPATRLPTRGEIAKLRQQTTPENPHPVTERVMLAFDSLWEYSKPWPEASARDRIHSWKDGGKWSVVWLSTRLGLLESIIGFDEEWAMFSPGTSRRKYVARARLEFADGSKLIVRNHGDPEDLTHYSHWFEEKILDHELKVKDAKRSNDESFGYCNLLRHRYPKNAAGARLVKIFLFSVRYDLTPPGKDPKAWLTAQTGPPPDQVFPDFYEYDLSTHYGKHLPDK